MQRGGADPTGQNALLYPQGNPVALEKLHHLATTLGIDPLIARTHGDLAAARPLALPVVTPTPGPPKTCYKCGQQGYVTTGSRPFFPLPKTLLRIQASKQASQLILARGRALCSHLGKDCVFCVYCKRTGHLIGDCARKREADQRRRVREEERAERERRRLEFLERERKRAERDEVEWEKQKRRDVRTGKAMVDGYGNVVYRV